MSASEKQSRAGGIDLNRVEDLKTPFLALSDDQILELITQLASDYVVRKNGTDESVFSVGDAAGFGVSTARTVIENQESMLGDPNAGQSA